MIMMVTYKQKGKYFWQAMGKALVYSFIESIINKAMIISVYAVA